MAQPNVNITRSNGNLNRTKSTTDNAFAMLMSGAAVAGKIALNEAKFITGTDDLTTLGITSVNNALAFAEITKFYSIVGNGVGLWIMLYSNATLMAAVCDKDTGIVRNLIDSGEGAVRGLFVNKTLPGGYAVSLTEGLDDDVWNTVTKLQALCEFYDGKNMPLFSVLPGFGFTVAGAGALRDLNTMTKNMVSICLGSDDASGKPAIATMAGWLAKTSAQAIGTPVNKYWQNIGRVASGSVLDAAWFIDGTPANDKSVQNLLDTIHDRRYIYFRKFNGKSGFFFNDDPCVTSKADDYSSISWNRVINKAKLIAYNTLIEKLNDDVDTDPETGGISKSLASDWESDVERDIKNEMIKKGAITGVKCFIDPDQVNLETDEVNVTLEIVRKGQAKTINVKIGFAASV